MASMMQGTMKLPELLEKYRIYTIRALCEKTGLSPQQGWHLWHHRRSLTRDTLKLLHEELKIPYEELMEVDPREPPPEPKSPRAPKVVKRQRPKR
jgi:transcriptional regulator with XRE-family HTH domain